MKINDKNMCIILFGVFIFASAIRIVLNSFSNIDNIVAAINIVSLWFVIYLILGNVENQFFQSLKETDIIGEQIKIKKRKYLKGVLKYTRFFVFIIGLIYVFIFANSMINDIIGLGALFLSIETEYLSDYIQDKFYKMK